MACVKRTVTVEIAGARYRIVTDAEEAYLQRLAERVNERVSALGVSAGRHPGAAQVLAVVALELVDELEACEARMRRLQSVTSETLQRAIERIDQRLTEGAVLAEEGGARNEPVAEPPHAHEPTEER